MVVVASPERAAVALIVPVATDPPLTVVPRLVVVPYSNHGVVAVLPAVIVPLNVAVVAAIAVGEFVRIEIEPTAVATFAAVHPPTGITDASSFALCWVRSVAISASVTPAPLMIS